MKHKQERSLSNNKGMVYYLYLTGQYESHGDSGLTRIHVMGDAVEWAEHFDSLNVPALVPPPLLPPSRPPPAPLPRPSARPSARLPATETCGG